jgi:hypothetical protein
MNDSEQPRPRWSIATLEGASTSGDLATAAEMLASVGIQVFPCVPGGKQPLTRRGFHDATADLSRVGEWWRRNPEPNIGLPTGAAAGIVVVDVDVHAGGSGYAAFERARSAGLVDAWGWLVRTPSGGIHAYFPPTPGSEQRSWQVPGQHVDFRGDGGYVVAPPSRVVAGDGRCRAYTVIAVAQHRVRPLDAAGLRVFLDPPRPIRPPASLPPVGHDPTSWRPGSRHGRRGCPAAASAPTSAAPSRPKDGPKV